MRDIPYRLPESDRDLDATSIVKHLLLHQYFQLAHIPVRFVVCEFRWADLPIPTEITRLAPEPVSTHLHLEYFEGAWKVLDASWDRRLAVLFPVNRIGVPMAVAVPALNRWTPEQSQRYAEVMGNRRTEVTITQYLPFFRAANGWLEEVREATRKLAA